LFLEAVPRRGEGLISFAGRLCGTAEAVPAIVAANGGRSRLLVGVRYRVPFGVLAPERQLAVARAIFPDDRGVPAGWEHRVRHLGGARESLWQIAAWFTGRGEDYRVVREANRLVDEDLDHGAVVLVPASLLRPSLRAALPPGSPYHLEYGRDARGEVAVYRLQPGEALYSSVVVRFTGRVFAEDVNSLALEIAERSAIRDVTDIPIGYQVKIPLDALLPEFLPADHPNRKAWEESLIASAQFRNTVTATSLQGVTVVLDAGHGGRDVGASVRGVWESVYVYDIMLRAKRLLETTTAASVFSTTQDGASWSVPDRDQLAMSNRHRILTEPPYPIADSAVGVNLRWYLANSLLRRTVRDGGSPAKVVFLSIHADSLHPSLRGAMVYIPGARYRGGSYGRSEAVYASRREVSEQPRVSFSSRELTQSEGLSRELAGHLIDAFVAGRLAVHPDRPVRDKIIRYRKPWVPAVLRYNQIPAGALVEVCNLANEEDRRLLLTRRYRQQVAEGIVRGLLAYYGDGDAGPPTRVASSAG
ncbi:MAG: N-acetylmuramoyl-L-alanine amidase family protein, partial [Thermoanaerobaculia bacterium]